MNPTKVTTYLMCSLAIVLLVKWVLYDGAAARVLLPEVPFKNPEIVEIWHKKSGAFISQKQYLFEIIEVKRRNQNGQTQTLQRRIPKHYGTWFREAKFVDDRIQLVSPSATLELVIP